jgi:hypothetical protein
VASQASQASGRGSKCGQTREIDITLERIAHKFSHIIIAMSNKSLVTGNEYRL